MIEPLLPKLLDGLLGGNGSHGLHGLRPGHGPEEADNDRGGDAAREAKEAALRNERTVEAGNDHGRWQSEGPNSNQGPNNNQGPHGGQGPNHADHGLPNPGDVLSNALGKADAALRNLLGNNGPNGPNGPFGQNGPNGNGPLGKAGDLASQLLNQAGQAANGLAAKSLESLPPASVTNAAGVLLTQAAAQALNTQGAQALAARNALHDAATLPNAAPAREAPATLQNTLGSNAVPASARAAESALIPPRQDVLPVRADQAVLGRTATAMPAGSTTAPAVAPAIVADATRAIPLAAPPTVVPPSQSGAVVDGRPGGITGGGDAGVAPANRADMAQQTPPGHTGAAPVRGPRPEEEDGESLAQKMVRAVAAWLGLGATEKNAEAMGDVEEAAPQPTDDRWLRLQWLFWALAVAGYGCLAIAVIVFIPGGDGFLDETRNPIVRPALVVGLGCSIAAWWLARKIARSR